MTPFEARGNLQFNLAHAPEHTYLYDQYEEDNLETHLDKIKLFTDVELGVSMEDFVTKFKTLSTVFVPVCSYHDNEAKNQNKEFVGALEGVIYPWFGLGFRLDRIQYSMENSKRDWTDHSKEAIQHAQKIGNLFIDEARMSENTYPYVSMEVNELNMF